MLRVDRRSARTRPRNRHSGLTSVLKAGLQVTWGQVPTSLLERFRAGPLCGPLALQTPAHCPTLFHCSSHPAPGSEAPRMGDGHSGFVPICNLRSVSVPPGQMQPLCPCSTTTCLLEDPPHPLSPPYPLLIPYSLFKNEVFILKKRKNPSQTTPLATSPLPHSPPHPWEGLSVFSPLPFKSTAGRSLPTGTRWVSLGHRSVTIGSCAFGGVGCSGRVRLPSACSIPHSVRGECLCPRSGTTLGTKDSA